MPSKLGKTETKWLNTAQTIMKLTIVVHPNHETFQRTMPSSALYRNGLRLEQILLNPSLRPQTGNGILRRTPCVLDKQPSRFNVIVQKRVERLNLPKNAHFAKNLLSAKEKIKPKLEIIQIICQTKLELELPRLMTQNKQSFGYQN